MKKTTKTEKCQHNFIISTITTEPDVDHILRKVGYVVCRKCGEIVRQIIK